MIFMVVETHNGKTAQDLQKSSCGPDLPGKEKKLNSFIWKDGKVTQAEWVSES